MTHDNPELARERFAALMQRTREVARRVADRVEAVRQQFTPAGESPCPPPAGADGLPLEAGDDTSAGSQPHRHACASGPSQEAGRVVG